MEMNCEEDEDWNDAQAWLVERALDHQQQDLEFKIETQFVEPDRQERGPRRLFRDYPGEGNQWDPQQQNFGFNDGEGDFH